MVLGVGVMICKMDPSLGEMNDECSQHTHHVSGTHGDHLVSDH